MNLRRSRFIHQIPLTSGRILIVHALTHTRIPADAEVDTLLTYFTTPQNVADACAKLADIIPYSKENVAQAIEGLRERGILTEKTFDEEIVEVAKELLPTHGRDPSALLETYRRKKREGSAPYWAAAASFKVLDLASHSKRVDLLLLGDCDMHMESDFLRQEAAKRGIDLHVSASFAEDVRFANDHKHDAIIIGALRSRHLIVDPSPQGSSPHTSFIAHASHMLIELRQYTHAPIFIDNLPEPTVQPLGIAEVGILGHRTRFRAANVALSDLVTHHKDVYVVDIAAALNAVGTQSLLDDAQVGFTHFGSPGWMLQRPIQEKAAVHNVFPDMSVLSENLLGNPYARENIVAATHINALVTVLGIDRKKCVILDLDGTLWPGVLAETGSPFAWSPEISGAFSYIGLYFGLHEALLCLKERGILLACVSKNDEEIVRKLWKYADHYPHKRLLTLDDFVTIRINWNDKAENIRSIADELSFDLRAFLFIDDHPVERDRIRQHLSEVEVWGENLFELRRRLLDDPRLQVATLTPEAKTRTELTKTNLKRQNLRVEALDENDYRKSLQIHCEVSRVTSDFSSLKRVEELLLRTTQFNTTGLVLPETELNALTKEPDSYIFTLQVSDKFGDQGLVGAAIIKNSEIVALVMSCRVLGMGVEQTFLSSILDKLKDRLQELKARIIETDRNMPVRHIYSDLGFIKKDLFWTYHFKH